MELKTKINIAKRYIEEQKYDQALTILEEVVKQNSIEIKKEALYLISDLLVDHYKDCNKALSYLKELFKYEDSKEKLELLNFKVGEIYIIKADEIEYNEENKKKMIMMYKKAVKYFKKSINTQDEELLIDVSIYLSLCYYLLKEYQKAIDTLEIIQDKEYHLDSEDYRELKCRLGICYFNIAEYEKAIKHFNEIDLNIIDRNSIHSILILTRSYYFLDEIMSAISTAARLYEFKKLQPEQVFKEDIETINEIVEDILSDVFPGEGVNLFLDLLNGYSNNVGKSYILYENYGDLCNMYSLNDLALQSYEKALEGITNNETAYERLLKKIQTIKNDIERL